MIVRFPLRPGVLAALKLPDDLTLNDVARITSVLHVLVPPVGSTPPAIPPEAPTPEPLTPPSTGR